MQLKPWGAQLALAGLLVASVLACRVTDNFIAQATVVPTRTARPTFTAIPPATPTPEPTWTPVPTQPPPPSTAKPTTRPATARPPTLRPATPIPAAPAPAQPTAFAYEWHANPPMCEHSGMTFIKAAVYSDKNDPGSRTPGIKVVLGAADGSTVYDRVTTDDNGEYTFMLNASGAKPGTWYVWIVDASGKRISNIGGPIITNNLGPDAPGTCWNGAVDFWK